MKILIADDNSRRYARLISELSAIGIVRHDVVIVPSAQDARSKLEHERFELFVLDILLPLWPESEPDHTHSLDLLTELHAGDQYIRPQQILGLTGDISVAGAASAAFTENTWTVIQYSETNEEWLHRILNCVRYLQKCAEVRAPSSSIDVAIICALERPEYEEVIKLPWNWESARPIDDRTFVQDGHFQSGDRRISVCATYSPRMGMVSAALRAANLITLMRPRILVMCGICAGVHNKAKLGDVLFADPSWDFQSGKRVMEDGVAKFLVAPNHLPAPSLVRSHVEQIRSDHIALNDMALRFGRDAPAVPRVILGPVATGSSVLADGRTIDEVKVQHRELIGIEMEAYGVYAAAAAASNPQPLAFALKSVCDFGDPVKDDAHQKYAAYTSANVMRLLMERYGARLLQ